MSTSFGRAQGGSIDTATIIAGFAVSTVGFSVFLYGKKARSGVPLAVGVALMALPFVVQDALWMSVVGVALVLGLRAGSR